MLKENKHRYSNFELCRIFAMFLIVLNHLCQYGGMAGHMDSSNLLTNSLYCWTGNLGNWLFILISGYFVSVSKFTWKKAFKVWFQVFSISVIIGLVLYCFKIPAVEEPISLNDLFQLFFPTFFANNWFATAYILFYMFTPFLNGSLLSFNEKTHRYLIVLMVVVGTVIKMIPGQQIFQTGYLFYFIMGYYIASYIRIYNPAFLNNQKLNIVITIFSVIFYILWIVLIVHYKDNQYIINHYTDIYFFPIALNRFPILLTAVFAFGIFKNMHITSNKLINTVAGTTFGVYLIHENQYLNKIIWLKLLKINEYLDSEYLFVYLIFAVVITFLTCSCFDLLRQKVIERPVLYFYDKIGSSTKKD